MKPIWEIIKEVKRIPDSTKIEITFHVEFKSPIDIIDISIFKSIAKPLFNTQGVKCLNENKIEIAIHQQVIQVRELYVSASYDTVNDQPLMYATLFEKIFA